MAVTNGLGTYGDGAGVVTPTDHKLAQLGTQMKRRFAEVLPVVDGLVARFAGRHWEGFFEALFGYEAKLNTRAAA